MIEITHQTLKEIGITDIPMIYAYNKADRTDQAFPSVQGDIIYLAAKPRIGITELVDEIRRRIFKDYVKCTMLIPYDKGSIVSYLNEQANVLDTSYEEEGTKLVLECKQSDYGRYKEYVLEDAE